VAMRPWVKVSSMSGVLLMVADLARRRLLDAFRAWPKNAMTAIASRFIPLYAIEGDYSVGKVEASIDSSITVSSYFRGRALALWDKTPDACARGLMLGYERHRGAAAVHHDRPADDATAATPTSTADIAHPAARRDIHL
jgi:hypothetical protein